MIQTSLVMLIIQLNSDIVYMEIAADPMGERFNPTRLPPSTLPILVSINKSMLESVLLTEWL